jgi:hypothetical protein
MLRSSTRLWMPKVGYREMRFTWSGMSFAGSTASHRCSSVCVHAALASTAPSHDTAQKAPILSSIHHAVHAAQPRCTPHVYMPCWHQQLHAMVVPELPPSPTLVRLQTEVHCVKCMFFHWQARAPPWCCTVMRGHRSWWPGSRRAAGEEPAMGGKGRGCTARWVSPLQYIPVA